MNPNDTMTNYFRWIPRGTTVIYRGCQVGIELSPEQQIAPVLFTMKKKLLNWSTSNLSFSVRITVVNSILLATMWYILSCRIFNKSCINQIQCLIKNFLWSGRVGNSTTKVAWAVIIQPRNVNLVRGLGIVDPIDQTRALLGKLVVRCLLLRNELWKSLLRERIVVCSPVIGQPWKSYVYWIFQSEKHFRCSRRWEDSFINGIWRSWSRIRAGLHLKELCQEEEFRRQPIT